MSYLNVAEVETALQVAAGPANAGFTELITLPHITWEGRTCRAIRVHHGPAAVSGVYFLGGVHAREWGSPDILVNFVKLLTDAYRTGTGISQGGMSLDAEKVAEIVNNLDVVVFPQVSYREPHLLLRPAPDALLAPSTNAVTMKGFTVGLCKPYKPASTNARYLGSQMSLSSPVSNALPERTTSQMASSRE